MKPFTLNRRDFTRSLVGAGATGALANSVALNAAPPQIPPLSERGRWFRDARFGMFIHFGLYTLLERGEWAMFIEGIPIKEYEKNVARFNPPRFKAADWVSLAKSAGQRYITFTSKHHDGFCMFNSRLTDYNVTHAPFGRDLLAELVEECHRQDMPIFCYYSLMDWHHPDYQQSLPPQTPISSQYIDYMKGQLRELCSNYGKIAGIWFDGGWDHKAEQWHATELLDIIYKLQPHALVNNRAETAADFSAPEQELGSRREKNDDSLRETCMVINDDWGYAQDDQRFKSSSELIQWLIQAAGSDTNFLLNIGPMPSGEVQPEFQQRLMEMGKWLERNGESLYGTRSGHNFFIYADSTLTTRDNKVYFHIFNWQRGAMSRINFDSKKHVNRAYVLEDGSPIELIRNPAHGDALPTSVSFVARNTGWSTADTVVVLETS